MIDFMGKTRVTQDLIGLCSCAFLDQQLTNSGLVTDFEHILQHERTVVQQSES